MLNTSEKSDISASSITVFPIPNSSEVMIAQTNPENTTIPTSKPNMKRTRTVQYHHQEVQRGHLALIVFFAFDKCLVEIAFVFIK